MNAMQKAVVKNMEWANSVPTYQVSRAITTDELDALYKEVSANEKKKTRPMPPGIANLATAELG